MLEARLSFTDTLAQMLSRIEGGVAAIILGIDGIPIERHASEPPSSLDIDSVATEFTTLLRRSARTATDTGLGELREMMLATEEMTFLLRPITPDYFLLLALRRGGNVGRARFELRKAQLALEAEFAI
jgi:predicted regulator of Ras-like GTPase activity (Roadblock/LC7/MglB family)